MRQTHTYHPNQAEKLIYVKTSTCMYIAVLFIITKTWRKLRSPSVSEWINQLCYLCCCCIQLLIMSISLWPHGLQQPGLLWLPALSQRLPSSCSLHLDAIPAIHPLMPSSLPSIFWLSVGYVVLIYLIYAVYHIMCVTCFSCVQLCRPYGLQPVELLCPGILLIRKLSVSCHTLLRESSGSGIKPGLLHCRPILCNMGHSDISVQWTIIHWWQKVMSYQAIIHKDVGEFKCIWLNERGNHKSLHTILSDSNYMTFWKSATLVTEKISVVFTDGLQGDVGAEVF